MTSPPPACESPTTKYPDGRTGTSALGPTIYPLMMAAPKPGQHPSIRDGRSTAPGVSTRTFGGAP